MTKVAGVRIVSPKSQAALTDEWNLVATARDAQIRSGEDRSLEEVLLPAILELVPPRGRVLDIGSGTGVLAHLLAERGNTVVGVDPSEVSVRIARGDHPQARLEFFTATVREWAGSTVRSRFDHAVANMVLMDLPDLPESLRAAASALRPGGRLVATITHPFFWPYYWGYLDDPDFRYGSESYIESPFRITAGVLSQRTTHIHRPLETYLAAFTAAGFELIAFRELAGPAGLGGTQPTYPRFALFEVVRRV